MIVFVTLNAQKIGISNMNISVKLNYNGSITLFAVVKGELVSKEYSCGVGKAKKLFQEKFGN